MINCPACGKLTDPKLDACVHCGFPLRAGTGIQGGKRTVPPVCPMPANCPGVQDGDIICVRCGINLLTGQKLAQEQKEQKNRLSGISWKPFAIAAGVIFSVALVSGFAFLVSRDPIQMARGLADQGQTLEAINRLNEVILREPDNVDALMLLGELHWGAQQFQQAADTFGTASNLEPGNADAARYAVAALDRMPGTMPKNRAIELFRRIVASADARREDRMLLALALGDAGDHAGQASELERIVLEGDPSGELNYQLGVALSLSGDLPGAATAFSTARQRGFSGGNTAAAEGMLNVMRGRAEAAYEQLSEAVQDRVLLNGMTPTLLGLMRMAEGRFEEARPLLQDGAGVSDPHPAATFFYTLCREVIGLEEEAIRDYDRIVEVGGPYAVEASIQLAGLLVAQGNISGAEEQLRRAITLGGESARLYTLQGTIRANQGQLEEAQRLFREAIRLDGDYPAARLENGLILIARNQLGEGLRELERFLDLAGDDAATAAGPEIQMLVTQLQQTIETQGGAAAIGSAQDA